MAVTIKTDKKWHYFRHGYDLEKKWRKEFDWIKSDAVYYSTVFIRYRGWVYAMDDFMHVPKIESEDGPAFAKWDGYMNDTYFSGVLIKLSSDGERYKIAMFYS